MEQQRYTYDIGFDDLPNQLPVFPLPGALLLPGGQLPLNIFEPCYLSMMNDAMAGNRLVGMIQPRSGIATEQDNISSFEPELYDTGCAGKITSYQELEDGRILVTLSGICRFQVKKEITPVSGYRRIEADWDRFSQDFKKPKSFELDREKLKDLLVKYFDHEGLSCNGDVIDEASDEKIVTCLSMICPLESTEKQALLEANNIVERAELFMAMIDMAVRGNCKSDSSKN